ncbi:MAG: hypothetical protein ACLQNE_29950 [Thermoguttaceae bacterium]|jgi:hypothetical protein
MRTVLEDRGIGWAYWSYNETFSVMAAGQIPLAHPVLGAKLSS